MPNRKLVHFIIALRQQLESSGLAVSNEQWVLDIVYKTLLICYNHCEEQSEQKIWEYALIKSGIGEARTNREAADKVIEKWNQYELTNVLERLTGVESIIRNNQKELSPPVHNMIVEVLTPLHHCAARIAS